MIDFPLVSRLPPRLRAALRLIWRLGDPRARNLALLEWERLRGLFQPEPTTRTNRYPDLFRFVSDQLGNTPEPRLLSFGCSTGEEVFSLRRYFPEATIRGLDINGRNLAVARRRLAENGGDPRITFALANSAEGEPTASYDAVFAMAVFRHGGLNDAPPRCDTLIRFADFERCAEGLARVLRPGGLFAIRHANFRFADLRLAQGFRPRIAAPMKRDAPPIYGRDDRLQPVANGDDGVYEKL